ncbi:MAG: 30S ribosomal protein S13 [Candidatus Marsarchaeota archaeon]|jgi:small subunit ribosomal protein S13|nr:30S ribosomal protein S13 [Candidatus Marsarchaeota archaeon]
MAEPKKRARQQEGQRATSIVRIANKDINGGLNIQRALDQVKGIGQTMSHSLSYVIEHKFNIDPSTPIGSLNESQVTQVEELIKDPHKYGVPKYLLNRRNDMDTGKDMHLIGNDLIFAVRQSINRDVTLRVWRGYRHQYGQKVRGQHTRSTGRTGATVGVTKKAIIAAQKPQAEEKKK